MNYFKILLELYCAKRRKNFSKKRIQLYQQRKLRKMLQYAYDNSGYYRKKFKEKGITKENVGTRTLKEFPIMTKKELLQNFDSLITVDTVKQEQLKEFDQQEIQKEHLFREKYHLVHSSGSTGDPGFFLYDKRAWQKMLVGIIRAALWEMPFWKMIQLLINKPKIVYIAATDGRYGGTLAVGDGIKELRMPQYHLNVQSPLEEWISILKDFAPDIVIGYPSAIKILAEINERENILTKVSRVITCGEPLPDALEKMFQGAYHCPIINVYGASESLALGVGISSEKGITLFDDMNVIEIEDGKMYLTCLYNYVQPLIRYELSDELIKESNEKSAFTMVKKICGRNEDLLWFQDDDKKEFLHPLSIEGICVKGLIDYQFRKLDDKTFEMIAEVDAKSKKDFIAQSIHEKMKEVLVQKHLDFVTFSIRFVDCIQPDAKTGKKKLIITE